VMAAERNRQAHAVGDPAEGHWHWMAVSWVSDCPGIHPGVTLATSPEAVAHPETMDATRDSQPSGSWHWASSRESAQGLYRPSHRHGGDSHAHGRMGAWLLLPLGSGDPSVSRCQ
jgi:hypothetical protein